LDVNFKGVVLERVSNKLVDDFPAATLYLDDLAEIVDTFVQACKKIDVTAGEFKIADPSELSALAAKFPDGRFADITIQGYEPYVSLELWSFRARAYVSEDSLEQRGVVSKVREVIHRRRKVRPDRVIDIAAAISLCIGLWQVMSKTYLLGGPLLFAAFALVPLSSRMRSKNTVLVYAKSRADSKSFFQRKKDDVLLAVIAAAFGAAASYAVAKFLP
jgi:hypothetical protein